MMNKTKSKHINVGTIGHIDHGWNIYQNKYLIPCCFSINLSSFY
jgi:hypothetical protein